MHQKTLPTIVSALIALLVPLTTGWGFLDFFDKDLQNAPGNAELRAQEDMARALIDQATALEPSNPDKARNIYRDVVKKYPLTTTAGLAQYKVGVLYRQEGKHKKSFEAFQDFVDNYKGSAAFASAVQAQYEIARDGQDGKVKEKFLGISHPVQPSELLDMYTKIIKNAPFSEYAPLSQFAMAEVYQEDGQPTEAIAAYQKMVDDYPRSQKAAEAQLRIGSIGENMLERGNQDPAKVDAARKAYEDLTILFPDEEVAAHARAGISKLDLGSAEKAYGVGRFYERQGHYTSARIYYEQVLAVPDSEFAAKAAERLAKLPAEEAAVVKASERKGFSFPIITDLFSKDTDPEYDGVNDMFPEEFASNADENMNSELGAQGISDEEWADLDRDMAENMGDGLPLDEEPSGWDRLAFWKKNKGNTGDDVAGDDSFAAPVADVDGSGAEKKGFLRMPKLPGFGKDKTDDGTTATTNVSATGSPKPVKVKNAANYVGPPAPPKKTAAVPMRLNSKAVPLDDVTVPEPPLDPDEVTGGIPENPEELLAPPPPAEVDGAGS